MLKTDNKELNVLLIEDNPGDARLIEELLASAAGNTFILERAERLTSGLARLAKGGTDLVLLDLSLPDSRGIETFTKTCAEIPIASPTSCGPL